MTRIPAAFNSTASNQPFSSTEAINDLDLGTFLELMIAELQNQDPLNPLDNKDMLAQISQIREVGATDQLTKTLESVLLGQNIASATNLIGADIEGVSDDNQRVDGAVGHVSISGGQPKLHLERSSTAAPSIEDGNVENGVYKYRIVWEGEDGKLHGLELGADTTSDLANYRSIRLTNLPNSPGAKQIYRTDDSGDGDYRLVATLVDGSQSSFHDQISDDERSETRLTRPIDRLAATFRAYEVSLNNVSNIRPPALGASAIVDDESTSEN